MPTGSQRWTRGEDGTLGGVGTTDEVLAVEQVVGGDDADPSQGDTTFDLGVEVRHQKAQRAETTEKVALDTNMPVVDVDSSVPITP